MCKIVGILKIPFCEFEIEYILRILESKIWVSGAVMKIQIYKRPKKFHNPSVAILFPYATALFALSAVFWGSAWLIIDRIAG